MASIGLFIAILKTLMIISPPSLLSRPPMILSKVDLPEPDFPKIKINPLSGNLMLTWSKAMTSALF